MGKEIKKWEPDWYADIDPNATDSDYIRKQECCTSCGGYIGELPGYYFIEDEICPKCRSESPGYYKELWSVEVRRLMTEYEQDKEYIDSLFNRCKKLNI